MRGRRSLGLAPRLVLALVVTSGLTLGVAALTLLSPLESRLRAGETETLVRSADSLRAEVRALDRGELGAGSPELRRIARAGARRIGGQALIVDPHGRLLATTDPDRRDPPVEALRAIATGKLVQRVVRAEGDSESRVAVSARTDGATYGIELRKTLNDAATAVGVVRRALVTPALVGLAAALLIGIGLARRLVRRLRDLRDAALRVAELGPVVEVAPDNARDEVADLGRAFSVMQQRLRVQEEARRTFVATASHELRTPLTSLRLMLDLLREDLGRREVDLDAARDQVDGAARLADRLGALAAQLLDLSRLDAGIALRREPVDLREACRSVLGEFAGRREAADRPLQLADGGPAWATADPGAVTQVLRVLLDNALRFGPPGAPIVVDPVAGEDEVRVRVCDEGPGVPEDERAQIFERFRRGSGARGESGFGLGLAIGRELARGMDGELALVDGSGGACFELLLEPVAEPAAAI